MSGDFGLVYPLWTELRGPAGLLDNAVGEVGLDHVTVPAITGPHEHFRLKVATPPNYFVTEGGWHFPPDASCYKSGPVRPRTARWFGKRDLLHQVCEYAAARSIPAIFRIDMRGVTSLLEHEPHLRGRNAWGDEVTSAGACVLNPDLRQLLLGTLEDLRRYSPAGLELVDWVPDLPTDRDRPRPMNWHPLARRLLDVCFCPACRQTATVAGSDPDQAARSIRVLLERLLSRPWDQEVCAAACDDPVLSAYLQVRRRDTVAWLRRTRETYGNRRRYLMSDAETCQTPARRVDVETFQPLLHAGRPRRPVGEHALHGAIRALDGSCGLALPVWRPFFDQADQFVRVVVGATTAGVSFFDFEGLDEAPDEAIDWLRQAVRFARRG